MTADERKPLVKLGVSKRAAGMPSARSEVVISSDDADAPPLPSGRSDYGGRPATAAGVSSSQYNAWIAARHHGVR